MATTLSLSPFQLEVDQILAEAQHRWLKTEEIAKVLRSHNQFQISAEAPNKPDNGSVFLFNRKVLRDFRKDGHSWIKAKNGSTVKEYHEKLKVGDVDVLNCYCAHSEEYKYFQRRSYWLLEEDLTHIVFVHYLDARGNETTLSPSRARETASRFQSCPQDLPLTDTWILVQPVLCLEKRRLVRLLIKKLLKIYFW